jgi:hypothetical protein
MTKFCSECGSAVEGVKFCAECGTPVDFAPPAPQPVAKLSHDEQVAILEREIAELGKQGWHVYGRVGPYEVSLRRKSGLTARQFLPLWVEEDGSLWTNASGVMEGGRLRDFPSLLSNRQVTLHPTMWKPAPGSASSPSPGGDNPQPGDAYRRAKRESAKRKGR